jgi:hypothetical protein
LLTATSAPAFLRWHGFCLQQAVVPVRLPSFCRRDRSSSYEDATMNRIYRALLVLTVSLSPVAAPAEDAIYEGVWRTTNRKLDGIMTCVVTDFGDGNWQGRFYGVWQGVKYDYTVTFAGPPHELRGKATIDGAHYDWKGEITEQPAASFKGTFGGTRYTGFFDLKEKLPAKTGGK